MILLLALGCSGPDTDSTCSATVTWDGFAHGFFTTYCVSCHSAANVDSRYGAPPNVNFDTQTEVLLQAERIRIRVFEQQDMPIGGGVYPDDLTLLNAYLGCPQ